MDDRLGLVQIYTGDGKGKTTAAVGLAVRAAGRGLKCRIIQFMKGATTSGENLALAALPNIQIDRVGLNLIGPNPPGLEEARASLAPALETARQAVNGEYDLVVLDEIITACSLGLISEPDIIELVKGKAENVELVLTGRGAGEDLISAGDLVTEMRLIKHPYNQGRPARLGIEF